MKKQVFLQLASVLAFALVASVCSGSAADARGVGHGSQRQHQIAHKKHVAKRGAASVLAAKPYTVVPQRRADSWWETEYQAHLARARQGGIDVLFLGDSITQMMKEPQLISFFGPGVDHFGIQSDGTQHLLFRLRNGELDFKGAPPKLMVILIGTNNLDEKVRLSAAERHEVFLGVQADVSEIRQRLPDTKILVLGILPREQYATHPIRAEIVAVNSELSTLADGKSVWFKDIGSQMLESDGSISRLTLSDLLHPTPAGFDRMFKAIKPDIDRLRR